MINLKPSEDIVPMSEFRNNLSDCAARARKSGRPLLLTQNGRASYVFMDLAAFEEIREKIEKMAAKLCLSKISRRKSTSAAPAKTARQNRRRTASAPPYENRDNQARTEPHRFQP